MEAAGPLEGSRFIARQVCRSLASGSRELPSARWFRSLKEVVRDKVLSFLGKRPRWADPGSRLLPAGRTANRTKWLPSSRGFEVTVDQGGSPH